MSVFRSQHWLARFGFAAVLGLGLIAGAAPAQAQFFGSWGYRRPEPPQLSMDAVAQRLMRAGFKNLQFRLNGNVYLVDANDRGGRAVRLVVDVKDGTVLQRFAAVAPRTGGPDGAIGAPPPGYAPPPGASPEARPRQQGQGGSRARPAPSEATVAPAPLSQPQQPATPPVAAPAPSRAEAPLAPIPAPVIAGPGYANGVPINPLD